MVSFQNTTLAIREFNSRLDQTPSLSLEKWHIHQVRAAELLGITGANDASATAILDEFCKCLKRGYAGTKSNAETYKPTNHPKIDVFNPEANQLNFHAYKRRTHAKTPYTGEMPSIDAASHDATYYRFGGGGETMSVSAQMDFINYVIGEHGRLCQHHPGIAEQRRKLWHLWATNQPGGALYETKHLPMIAMEYGDYWDEEINFEVSPTPSQLGRVKCEIINALVASYVLDPSLVSSLPRPTRRSLRNIGDNVGGQDVDVVAAPDIDRKRKLDEDSPSQISESDDELSAGGDDSKNGIDVGMRALRKIAEEEDGLTRIGILELAFKCAHEGETYPMLTRKLFDLDQSPIGEDEYKGITNHYGKSRLARLRRNFDAFKTDYNKGQAFKIRDDQLLLEYLLDARRYSDGTNLPRQLSDSHGLKPDFAFMFRHIYYTHPKIGLKNLTELFIHVMLLGTSPTEDDFVSTSTIRCHIAMLNEVDHHLQGEEFCKRTKVLSPCGNKRHFALLSDDTKHGKLDNRHVTIVTCDREVINPESPYHVSPYYTVVSNSKATEKTSAGNSDVNIDSVLKIIPLEALAHCNGQATDNAPDAQKEADLTFGKIMATLATNGKLTETFVNGVERRAIKLGDPFHIDQLAIKHASEGGLGKTEKGNHCQRHHRQTLQTSYDVFIRDVHLIKHIIARIIESLSEEVKEKLGAFKYPSREMDTRWLSNSRAAKYLLKYISVCNDEGVNFWVLLYRELQLVYTDWRQQRCKEMVQWMMSPSIIAGLFFEAELGDFFEVQYAWHAASGELADRAGFRSLELNALYMDHCFPWWESALADFGSKFSKTKQYLDSLDDQAFAQDKLEQLKIGVKKGHAEIAKMTNLLMSAPWIFTLMPQPNYGADVALAMYKFAHEQGLNFDDDLSIVASEWGFHVPPEVPSQQYLAFYAKIKQSPDETTHWLYQLGFMRATVRDEAKLLTKERGSCRNPKSSTRLLDFAAVYPKLFDQLHSEFALYPSNTRIVEQTHGVERHGYDGQSSIDFSIARLDFIVNKVYRNRSECRKLVLEREAAKQEKAAPNASNAKKRKVSVKHNDRKYTLEKQGQQLLKDASQYTRVSLKERVPHEVMQANCISKIKARGTDTERKAYAAKKVASAKAAVNKRIERGVSLGSLETEHTLAQQLRTEHDLNSRNQAQTDSYNKLRKVMTKTFWQKISTKDGRFYDEIEQVLPKFYSPQVRQQTKTSLMLTAGAAHNSVVAFLKLAQNISDRKVPDTLSEPDRVEELRDVSSLDYLLEFVKVESSLHLADVEEKESEKMAPMFELMKIVGGTEISSHSRYQLKDDGYDYMTTKSTSYCERDYLFDDDDDLSITGD